MRSTVKLSVPIIFMSVWLCACGSPANGDTAPTVANGDDKQAVVVIDGESVDRGQYKKALFERYAENHLENFIETHLIEKKAKEMGVVADEKKIAGEVEKNVETLLKTRFGGNEANMRQALLERNMSLEGWRKDLETKTRRDQLLNAMIIKTRDAESESVKKSFEQQYGEGGLKYRVRHILVSTKVINTRFYAKSEYTNEKAKIEDEMKGLGAQLLGKLAKGEDFAKTAKEHSDDYTANRGGDLGEAWKGRFGKAFDDVVKSLKVGGRSQLVRAKRGYHIIEVTKINAGVEYQGAAILVSTGPNGPADKRTQPERDKDAQKKVAEVVEALKSKKFAEVATEMSDDTATKARGGDLGIFSRRRLGKEVDVVLENAKPGSVTESIKTPRGYWIVKLESRKALPEKDRRVVRHIFLSVEYDDVKKRRLGGKLEEMARKKADDLKARVDAGGDFKTLAVENTEDAYTRKAGGEYYNYRKSSLGPEVWDAVQKLEANKGSALVKSNRGFHVVQLIEKKETIFDDVKAELLKGINEKPISPADARLFLDEIKRNAKVERKIGTAPSPKLDGDVHGLKSKKAAPSSAVAPVKVKEDKPEKK